MAFFFFRICGENRTRCQSKQKIDATVTMASQKRCAVCMELEQVSIKINVTFQCVGGNLFKKLKCCSKIWDALHLLRTSGWF